MFGDQNADTPFAQMQDDLLDVDDGDGIDAGEWLVQQHEPRFAGQGSGNLHSPSFTAGQAHGRLVAQVVDAEFLKQFLDDQLALAIGQFLPQFQHGHQIFRHRQLAEDGGFLRQIADTQTRPFMHL